MTWTIRILPCSCIQAHSTSYYIAFMEFLLHCPQHRKRRALLLGIVDWRMLARLNRLRIEHPIVILATLRLTVFVDLITAVAMGLVAGGMVHARRLERLGLDSVVSVPMLEASFFADDMIPAQDDAHAARVGMAALGGTLSVASSHKLVSVLGPDIREHEGAIFDFSGTGYIDDSAAKVIRKLLDIAAASGPECIAMELRDDVAATLLDLDILGEAPADRVVETLDEARRIAREAPEINAAARSGQ